MPIPKDQLHEILSSSFPSAKIEIIDLVGDNNHYSVTIIDKIFAGKNRIEQHRIVNNSLKGRLGDELHAMQLKTSAV
jgi:stress-induced morphogen